MNWSKRNSAQVIISLNGLTSMSRQQHKTESTQSYLFDHCYQLAHVLTLFTTIQPERYHSYQRSMGILDISCHFIHVSGRDRNI